MAFLKWDESFSVKVAEIDEQHMNLIEMVNRFYEAQRGGSREALRDLLSSLAAYATFHFSTEEKYFNLYGYEQAASHIYEHRLFAEKVKDITDRLDSGKLVVSVEITNYLREWLISHVKGVDQQYTGCFNRGGLY